MPAGYIRCKIGPPLKKGLGQGGRAFFVERQKLQRFSKGGCDRRLKRKERIQAALVKRLTVV